MNKLKRRLRAREQRQKRMQRPPQTRIQKLLQRRKKPNQQLIAVQIWQHLNLQTRTLFIPRTSLFLESRLGTVDGYCISLVSKTGLTHCSVAIMYCFWGISLATQHYINPSIDIIKRKGVLSSESMNATLLAMTNSAAESFIIMCSIWFGVSDIGISTVVQQAAFYSLIIQGKFT